MYYDFTISWLHNSHEKKGGGVVLWQIRDEVSISGAVATYDEGGQVVAKIEDQLQESVNSLFFWSRKWIRKIETIIIIWTHKSSNLINQ